jgi:hypothetical protein
MLLLKFHKTLSCQNKQNSTGKRMYEISTVNRPKFGNGPLVRQPLSEILKNHISAGNEVSNLVQKAERLYIFFWTKTKINNWG